jgi:hypothetical protein
VDSPVDLTLSTQGPGASALTGPLANATGVTAESDFTIPAFNNDYASNATTCQDGTIPFIEFLNGPFEFPATDTVTDQTITLRVSD